MWGRVLCALMDHSSFRGIDSNSGKYWQLKCVGAGTWEQVGPHGHHSEGSVSAQIRRRESATCVQCGSRPPALRAGMGLRSKGEGLSWLAGKVDCVLNDGLGILFCNKMGRNQKLWPENKMILFFRKGSRYGSRISCSHSKKKGKRKREEEEEGILPSLQFPWKCLQYHMTFALGVK